MKSQKNKFIIILILILLFSAYIYSLNYKNVKSKVYLKEKIISLSKKDKEEGKISILKITKYKSLTFALYEYADLPMPEKKSIAVDVGGKVYNPWELLIPEVKKYIKNMMVSKDMEEFTEYGQIGTKDGLWQTREEAYNDLSISYKQSNFDIFPIIKKKRIAMIVYYYSDYLPGGQHQRLIKMPDKFNGSIFLEL